MYRIVNKKKLYATMAADTVGKILYAPASLFRRAGAIEPESIKRILVIRTAYIGDVVMTLPMLAPLKERFPGASITFLTARKAAELLEDCPYIDDVITYDPFWFYSTDYAGYRAFKREYADKRFDLVIEARADIRDILFLVRPLKARHKVSYAVGGGAYMLTDVVPYADTLHRVDYHLEIARFLGCDVSGEIDWGIRTTEDEEEGVDALLDSKGIGESETLVGIQPGSRLPLKCWSPRRYAKVADMISEELGARVILTGAPEEMDVIREVLAEMRTDPVVVAGRTTLKELAALIRRLRLFICNDSSPMHIAAAMGTPTVAIFGPSKSPETGPYGRGHYVVEKDFPCRPACDENKCNYKDYNQCMKDVLVEDVVGAVKKAFSR